MKLFSKTKGLGPVLITLGVMVLLACSYLLIYLPQNERRLNEQGFRSLQNIDRNIHSKLENSSALLHGLLSAYENKKLNTTVLTGYIKKYPTNNFTLQPIRPETNVDLWLGANNESAYTIQADSATQGFLLLLVKRSQPKALKGYSVGMHFEFKQFIQPLLPDGIFEQYIVFSKKKIGYETFPSGLGITNEDTLLKSAYGLTGPTIRSQMIGGIAYKMYLQPVSFATGKWIIAGLIADANYQQDKNKLPWATVLLMLTVTLMLVVAIPWLKLYQMGSQDRLTTSDGFWALIVSMLMMSLIFFMLFKYNANYRPVNSPEPAQLLAANIDTAFTNEVASSYKALAGFDDIYINLKTDIRLLGSTNIELGKYYLTSVKSNFNRNNQDTATLNKLTKQIGTTEVYWLDKKGYEIENWTSDTVNSPPGNFSPRAYFHKTVSGNAYQLAGSPSDSFYLDQIISWTSSVFRTVIAKKSATADKGTAEVVAMAFDMKCVDNAILPAGKTFAIINQNADVLYHSQARRNLNENLLQEFSESGKLRSSLIAGYANGFDTRYFGKEYRAWVRPMASLPYFVVVLSDLSFKETAGLEIFGFTTSMLFFFFLFILVQLFMVFMVSPGRSYYKKSTFDTSWIGPKISFRKQYMLSTLLNGLLLALLVLAWFSGWCKSFFEYLCILLFSVLFIGLFLNGLLYKRYKIDADWPRKIIKLKTIGFIGFLVGAVNLLAFCTLDNPLPTFVLFEAVCFFLGWVLYKNGETLLLALAKIKISLRELRQVAAADNKVAAKKTHWDYLQYFSLMSLLRLVITSGLPAVFFYIMAFNYEQNLLTRFVQQNFAASLQKKFPGASINVPELALPAKGVYPDHVFVSIANTVSTQLPPVYTKEDSLTIKTLGAFRFYKGGQSGILEHFHLEMAPDTSFFFNHMLRDACMDKTGTITYYKGGHKGNYQKIYAIDNSYQLPLFGPVSSENCIKGILFWLFLAGALWAFYRIILSVIKKLFVHNLPNMEGWQTMNNLLLENNQLNNLIFIIGAPGSEKLKTVLRKIKSGKIKGGPHGGIPLTHNPGNQASGNVLIVDMIQMPDADNKKDLGYQWEASKEEALENNYELVIIDHFEYNIKCRQSNTEKLNFIENLMLHRRSKLIIISTIHPLNFLDSFHEEQRKKENLAVTEISLERWQVLLGHFSIVTLPLAVAPIAHNNWRPIIKRETHYTHFLQKMRPTVIDTIKELKRNGITADQESITYNLHTTAHHFYLYIWQSLTKEEKFLLYDLAEDGLVNAYDDYNLCMLMSKGLIIRQDGTLTLFNHGFRNFILTAIGNTEFMKIKEKIRDNGNWGKLKTPLTVVIVAVLAFLLASQQETYSKLIAYVSALAAGVPAILRVFAFFDKGEEKK